MTILLPLCLQYYCKLPVIHIGLQKGCLEDTIIQNMKQSDHVDLSLECVPIYLNVEMPLLELL